MPLRDGQPTRHELRVAELCAASPVYEAAWTDYMASDPERWRLDGEWMLDPAEDVDDLGEPIDDERE